MWQIFSQAYVPGVSKIVGCYVHLAPVGDVQSWVETDHGISFDARLDSSPHRHQGVVRDDLPAMKRRGRGQRGSDQRERRPAAVREEHFYKNVKVV